MNILKDLHKGINKWHTPDGPVTALISTSGVGGRYVAVVITPKYIVSLGDSRGVQDMEGIITFYNRIAPKLEKIIKEFGGFL